jgi:hypothetical protein
MVGDAALSTENFRHKPHFLPMGRAFLKAKFKCPRCYRTLDYNGFDHLFGVRPARGEGHYLHPFCKRCRKELRSKWLSHPEFTTEVHTCMTRLVSTMKGGARTRDIAVAVDADDLLGLWFQQGGKCALSGYPMLIKPKSPHFKDPMSASVDRIDSDGIYRLDNVQLVCVRANLMKGDMHHNDLVEWCKRILAHQLAKEDELLKLVS